MVIVILGILAATAAPKFIDLSSDAKVATLEGFKAGLSSAMKIFYAKAIIQEKNTKWHTINDTQLSFGYPRAVDGNLQKAIDFSEDDFKVALDFDNTTGAGIAYIFPASNEERGTCHVKYVDVIGTYTAGGAVISFTEPILSIETDGC